MMDTKLEKRWRSNFTAELAFTRICGPNSAPNAFAGTSILFDTIYFTSIASEQCFKAECGA